MPSSGFPKTKKNKKTDQEDSNSSSEEEIILEIVSASEEEDIEMNDKEFKKYLKRMFPNCKNLNKKIQEMDEIDRLIDEEIEKDKKKKKQKKTENTVSKKKRRSKRKVEEEEEEYERPPERRSKRKKSKKKIISDSESEYIPEEEEIEEAEAEEEEEEELYETEEEVDFEEMDEKEIVEYLKDGMQMNLVFTLGGNLELEEEEETTTEEEEEEEEEVETETEIDETYKNILQELKKYVPGKNEKGRTKVLEKLEKMAIKEQKEIVKKEKKEVKKNKKKNMKTFKKLLNDKNIMNDFKYFEKMDINDQKKILAHVEEINSHTKVDKPYRIQLIESSIPIIYKNHALKKINMLKYMDPGSGEYYKVKQWVDAFMKIPFNKYSTIPASMKNNSVDEIHAFMEESKNTLNSVVYGLNDAKMQIMQMIGQWISNPGSVGNAIAIKGPMGTGKTTLIKDGISKILNRPFAFIPLGGATDSSYLEGHSYTYEGSLWGKIVDFLINCGSMNPVFYFDELDKVSDTPKGEEIIGILTHLTDTTQNSQYHDKYFSNIDFDLSQALFIFSYNEEEKVNPILKDRMYRIETKGYSNSDKIIIANDYLLPSICDRVNFEKEQIIIPDDTINYINSNLTNGEKGVRNLKRCLETIYTKINLFRLMKPESNLFNKDVNIKVEFPFTVTQDVVNKLIKKHDGNVPPYGMYT